MPQPEVAEARVTQHEDLRDENLQHENPQPLVVGRAPDREHAQRAARHLQSHGVDAADVKLAGSAAEEAEAHIRRAARDEMDAWARSQAGRQAEAGALIGALAGAAIGAGGGLLATSGDISGRMTLFLAIVFVFTGLGAWVGSVLTAAEALSYDDAFPAGYGNGDGATWIAVRVHDSRDAVHTRALLRREGITLVEERTAEALSAHTALW
jgi:hypothetical protein